jgi:LSD1 subclass zinc finger protein
MLITVICPHLRCRTVLQVPETARGQKVRCSRCGKNFIVPAPKEAGASKPAAPNEPEPAN